MEEKKLECTQEVEDDFKEPSLSVKFSLLIFFILFPWLSVALWRYFGYTVFN